MAIKNYSNLAYLMDVMDITGRELAQSLHIDYSLVSKWRTNNRPLSTRSAHLKNLADYFITTAFKNNKIDSLLRIANEFDTTINGHSPEELAKFLCQWLTVPPKSFKDKNNLLFLRRQGNYTVIDEVYLYKGNKGRREAVLQFLDYALTLPEGQQLLLVSQEDMDWMVEDEVFLNQWKQKLTAITQKKHKIKIIHWVDRNVANLASILKQWLPLHLTGQIESWFYPKYSDTSIKFTLFIIENHIAITGMSGSSAKKIYTSFHTNPLSLEQHQWAFETILEKCHQLVTLYPPSQLITLLEQINQTPSPLSSFYFISPSPITTDLSTGLLALQQKSFSLHRNCVVSFRHVYLLDELKKALDTSSLLRDHLVLLIEMLKNQSDFEVALITSSYNPMDLPINIWVTENANVLAWAPNHSPYITLATEPTIVNSFFYYYQNLWEAIPKVNRSKGWVIEQLEKLIN